MTSVEGLVSWMGAIQSQDLKSAMLAIAVRLPQSTEKMVYDAFEKGEVIRTHILRPTWHIVAAEDYREFMELTAPNIRPSLKYRRAQLGLDDEIFSITNPALKEMLDKGNHLTREQITEELRPLIPGLDSSMMNHILIEAELNCFICSGRITDGKATFALAEEVLSNEDLKKPVDLEEAKKKMAYKYFSSHGPATIADFSWWSGMPVGVCRKALAMVKDQMESFTDGKTEYWFNPSVVNHQSNIPELVFLPAYDEFIIAYRDRSAVLSSESHTTAISSNGVFRPVVVHNGKVVGLWSKKKVKGKEEVEVRWFVESSQHSALSSQLEFSNIQRVYISSVL